MTGIRSWLAQRRHPNRPTVAVGLSADRVRLYQPGKPGQFVEANVSHAGEWGQALAGLLQPLQLQGARVQVVLAPGLYQVLQVEKPNVPDEELPGALPWAVKDFVSEPVLQLAMDYFELRSNPAAAPRLAVVVTPKSRVAQIAEAVNDQAQLESIVTEELALADLLGAGDGVQLLLFQPARQEPQLLVVHKGQLCFTRQLRGFARLTDGAADPDLLDSLALELQRSLDYLISQLKLPEAGQLWVACEGADLGALVRHLGQQFSMNVQALANPAVAAGLPYLALYGVLQGASA